MNAERRKELESAIELIEQAKDIVVSCASAEQEYFDNMPESMQSSDKGTAAEDAAQQLYDTEDNLTTAIDQIREAIG